ncbi:hypothetical protein EMPS_03312 [Entomortierella parvispora]|uniref:Fucosyltransferase n=1 Tax=Entomortierella parvispora TaxID=205924 RepID=A0A9P3H6J3_9FUNG|nr:hypothetical protein EMPS_03312 [Entomortierella parvispora]
MSYNKVWYNLRHAYYSASQQQRKRLYIATVAGGLVTLLLLQMYVSRLRSRVHKELDLLSLQPPSTGATYFQRNPDPAVYKRPSQIVGFCNNLPIVRHPRGILITRKTKDEPLRIFHWKQWSYGQVVDWQKESRSRTPRSLDGELDADIIFMDYPFFDFRIQQPPYFDMRRFPPRVAHQRWVFQFGQESVGYFNFVGLKSYLQQFDFLIGSPPSLMDLPLPLYAITKERAMELADVRPSFPADRKPEHLIAFMVSNCDGLNNRNHLMHYLVKHLGAHSYGHCLRNTEIPKELEDAEKEGRMSWDEVKRKTLATYPFILAAENSNCVGYITEKIYDALAVGAIPVYMGAPDIANFVPEGSYIDASSFRSHEDLVQYLERVDRESFYRWKSIVKQDPTKFCKSCFTVPTAMECNIMNNVRFV